MGLFDGFKKRKKDYKEVAADNTKLSERDRSMKNYYYSFFVHFQKLKSFELKS